MASINVSESRGIGEGNPPFSFTNLLILGAFALGIFLLDALGTLSGVHTLATGILAQPRANIYAGIRNLELTLATLPRLDELRIENDLLQTKLAEMESKLAAAEVVFEENAQLIKETGINYKGSFTQVGVEVVGLGEGQLTTMTINKGSVDNIKSGDILVFEDIAVGVIKQVNPYLSEVELLTSPTLRIPAKTAIESGLGQINGSRGNNLLLKDILQNRPLAVGDKVYTSGLGNIFPADLYIGRVLTISVGPSAVTREAEIEYPINLRRITKFKVLVSPE